MEVNINYLAVAVAAVAAYIIGWLWYGPFFGKPWLKLSGIKEFKPAAVPIILGLIGVFLMSWVFDQALIFVGGYLKMTGICFALIGAFINWIGFIAPVTLGTVIYEKKPWSLWILNNAYWLISLIVIGIILTYWK